MNRAQYASLIAAFLVAGCQCPKTSRPAHVPSAAVKDYVPAVVTVKGNVANSMVPWSDDLTVSKAILMAEYWGARDPVSISVRRDGELFFVSPTRLLQGIVDPWLEPGDILELHTGVLVNPPLEIRPYRRVVFHWEDPNRTHGNR
jgi:hypothetical protein